MGPGPVYINAAKIVRDAVWIDVVEGTVSGDKMFRVILPYGTVYIYLTREKIVFVPEHPRAVTAKLGDNKAGREAEDAG